VEIIGKHRLVNTLYIVLPVVGVLFLAATPLGIMMEKIVPIAIVAVVVAISIILTLAFEESKMHGFLSLLPPYLAYYCYLRWERCRAPTALFMSGLSVLLFYDHVDYERSKAPVARGEVKIFMKVLDSYKRDVGHYPSNLEGLAALKIRPKTAKSWHGPYLSKDVPTDPWGRPFIYKSPDKLGDKPEILSYGADGLPGGKGEAADISSKDGD
jgi:general secretion pathway protein G